MGKAVTVVFASAQGNRSRDVRSTCVSRVKVKMSTQQKVLAATSVRTPVLTMAFTGSWLREADKGNVKHGLKAFKGTGT